jgi:predicted Rdx family selenoprotein
LAAELQREFPDAQVELRTGAGGRFEVSKDGVPVFEKSKLGRQAQPGEVARLLRAAG